jgi:translation initiation factor IF-2
MFEKLVAIEPVSLIPSAEEELHRYAKEVALYRDVPASDDEMVRRIGDADAVLLSYTSRMGKEVIAQCPNIRYIGMCCSLYSEESANVDIAYARTLGIQVLGIRDYGDRGVVEYVLHELTGLLHGFGMPMLRDEPVEITGLTAVPEAGDLFEAVEDERLARELAEQRIAAAKEKQFSSFQKVTLDNLFSQMAQNDMKELAIVVKADVQGSAEAVKQSLEKISNDEVRVRVIHAGVGAISKSDVDLADASNAIIIGFNVRPDNVAKEEAAATKVEMRMYRVIYDAINDVTDAMKGMLAPKFREVSLGELQVRQVYKISNVGTVAGCRVTSGKITRDSKVRVVRDGIVIAEDEIASLKRFKDDAKEVAEGYECGVTLEKFADVKEGDVYEAFKMEEYRD